MTAVSCVPVIRYAYSIRLHGAKKQDQKRKIQPGIFLQNEKSGPADYSAEPQLS